MAISYVKNLYASPSANVDMHLKPVYQSRASGRIRSRFLLFVFLRDTHTLWRLLRQTSSTSICEFRHLPHSNLVLIAHAKVEVVFAIARTSPWRHKWKLEKLKLFLAFLDMAASHISYLCKNFSMQFKLFLFFMHTLFALSYLFQAYQLHDLPLSFHNPSKVGG